MKWTCICCLCEISNNLRWSIIWFVVFFLFQNRIFKNLNVRLNNLELFAMTQWSNILQYIRKACIVLTGKDLMFHSTALFSGTHLAWPVVVLNLGESASLGTGTKMDTLLAVERLLNWLRAWRTDGRTIAQLRTPSKTSKATLSETKVLVWQGQ